MKKIFALTVLTFLAGAIQAQILFSDKFNLLTLQTDVQVVGSKTTTTTFTTAPVGYDLVEDGYKNNVGTTNGPNKPFNVTALKTKGWAVLYSQVEKDTFLVTTSWLDTNAATKRFIITPVINNITANSVLSWEAKSPDPNFPEGYEVYITTNASGSLTASSFNIADRVFNISDGNTIGGGEKTVWTKRGVSLAAYAGQNIRIAFKNISQNMYQLWLDDIKVENITNGLDVALSEGQGIYKYNKVNTNGNINCRATNSGTATISALTLNYSIKGPANYNYTQAFSFSQALTPYAFSDLTFNLPYNIPTAGFYNVKIWVSFVNGFGDQNTSNDTIYSSLSIMSAPPVKNVLVEQFLSAFDGNSLDGQDKLSALTASNVIAVNIHAGDSLENTSASGVINAYRKNTTTAMFDRNYFNDASAITFDRPAYTTRLNQRKSALVPASVTITSKSYNSSTRELTFTVQANFVSETQGDYRLNAYITENNVSGNGSDTTLNGWNQLSFMYNVPFSQYYQQGYYLPSANGHLLKAWQYRHQNVLDTMLDGSFGAAGVIPSTGGTLNQNFTKVYTYTVPNVSAGVAKHNPDNLYIVATVSEFNSNVNKRTVLNCYQEKVTAGTEVISVNELINDARFALYPNPASSVVNVLVPENSFSNTITISITDILGKVVYRQNSQMRFGLIQLNLYDLSNGAYFINLHDGSSSRTQKLIISK